jgi:hypothetical protein
VALEIFGSTSVSTTEYARLDALITRASQYAETYVGYPLTAQYYRETVRAFGDLNLMVSRTPLRAVVNLFDDPNSTSPQNSTEYRIENREAGFIQRDIGFEWTAQTVWSLGSAIMPRSEIPQWAVEYTAGYVYGGMSTASTLYSTVNGTTSTGRTLPPDIEAAVIAKVRELYVTVDPRIASKKVGDLEIAYKQQLVGSEAAQYLDPYVRVAVT